jgi:hypothetical protein
LIHVQPTLIAHGFPDQATLDRCEELGGTLAAGLELNMY